MGGMDFQATVKLGRTGLAVGRLLRFQRRGNLSPERGDRISREVVKCADIDETLSWGMTMLHPALLIARRDQKLVALNDKQCTYQTWDAFSGLLTPLVIGLFGKDMKNGFDSVAHALEEHFNK